MKHLSKSYDASIIYVLFSLPFFLSLGILSAAGEKAEQITTKISVVTFVSLGDDYNLHWKESAESAQSGGRVWASASSVLSPVKYHGPRVLTLGRPKTIGDEAVFDAFATVSLPQGSQVVIALLPKYKSDKSSAKYSAIALNLDESKIATGSRYLINLTKVSIRGILGGVPFDSTDKDNRKFDIAPAKGIVLPPYDKNAAALTGNHVVMQFQSLLTKEWEPMVSKRWFYLPKGKEIVFIYGKPGDIRPRVTILN